MELSIPEDEEKLQGALKYYSKRLSPEYQILERAKAASQAGEREKALELYRDAVKKFPEDGDAQLSLAWELERQIKPLASQNPPDTERIKMFLHEYAPLDIPKPGTLHSIMLAFATRIAESFSKYVEFVRWWDLSNLQATDYEPYKPESGESYPSLAERIIRALYKATKTEKKPDDLPWIIEFVRENVERYPEQKWFPYYLGKLLIWSGRAEAARDLVLPVVRSKATEFWAWDVLADTYSVDDVDAVISCLCKAAECGGEEKFLIQVRQRLGLLLKIAVRLPEAKHELELAVATRQRNDWRLPDELQRETAAPWYTETEASKDNRNLYHEYTPRAKALLLQGMPSMEGLISGIQPSGHGKPARSFIAISVAGELREIPARHTQIPELADLKPGSPVDVILDTSSTRSEVLMVTARNAEEWDLYPKLTGVVSHINRNKNLSFVLLGAGEDQGVIVRHRDIPDSKDWPLGQVLQMRVRTHKDERGERTHVVNAIPSETNPELPFLKLFKGSFCARGRFGFVSNAEGIGDDIFVPPDIVQGAKLADTCVISGTAIQEWNSRKGRAAWKAVTLDS